MRPYALLYFYRRRLRVHAVQELLAGVGVAIAVALVFAALVAEGSVAGSAHEVVRAVVGPANLQLRAREGEGFDERLLAPVEHIAGVKQAAPLLEQIATIRKARRPAHVGRGGGHRREPRRARTAWRTRCRSPPSRRAGSASAGPPPTRSASGGSDARVGETGVAADSAGSDAAEGLRRSSARNRRGALARTGRGDAPRAHAAAGRACDGRITRILVAEQAGGAVDGASALEGSPDGRLDVAPADQDVALLRQALRPSDQASQLFAAIGALLGLLLAFNAMLLTVPERRQAIAELRIAGTRRLAIVQMVALSGVCSGSGCARLSASCSATCCRSTSFTSRRATWPRRSHWAAARSSARCPLLLAAGGGVLATCLASAIPLLDLSRGRARDAVYVEGGAPGNTVGWGRTTTAVRGRRRPDRARERAVRVNASDALLATAVLALATVLAVPLVLAGVLRAMGALAGRLQTLTTLPIALASLRATTLRSLALAATGAVALFGSVALGGSRENLLGGIRGFAASYVADAEVWVANPGDNQAVNAFPADDDAARIAAVPQVASVHAFAGGFLALGGRRVWIIARPPGGSRSVLQSQIVEGSEPSASERLGEGGWIAVSAQIAKERHVGVGGVLELPTPTGNKRFRVAATTTNLAWSPGVIFMSTADFARYWGTSAPTAFGIDLRPEADAARCAPRSSATLGPTSGLAGIARRRSPCAASTA